MDTAKVCCNHVEEQLWACAADNDFGKIIELLVGQGVTHNDMGEELFAYAEQAIVHGRFDAARSIFLFLVSSLDDKSEAPPLLILIGDLYVKENKYDKAREYYGQLPLTVENIKKTFSTFIPLKDMEGLLAVRDNILSRLTESNHVSELNRLVHNVFVEIASDPALNGLAREQYLTNLQHLQKIDPAIIKKLSNYAASSGTENRDPDALKCLRVSGKIYVRNGQVWEMVRLRPPAERLKRQSLKQGINIALRCASLAQLIEFRDALATDHPEFYKFQCYLIVNLDFLERFMMVEDLFPLTDSDFITRVIDERDLEGHFAEVLVDDKKNFPSFLVHFTEEDIPYAKEHLVPFLNKCKQKINIEIENCEKQLANLYPIDFSKSIQDKIKNKKLRILFQTSNYTTFLQYATRDMADGFKKLGFEVFVETEEKRGAVGIRSDICMKNLIDFRPDLIFNISHLRFEYPWIPKSIPYVTWVQDKLEPISSGQYLSELTPNDILFSQTFYNELIDIGYKNISRLPIPVNSDKFNKAPKKNECSFDITYVNHAPSKMAPIIDHTEGSDIKSRKIFSILADQIHSKSNSVISIEDYQNVLSDILEGQPNLEWLLELIRNTSGNYLHRTIVLDWLIDGGYKPTLYGKGWQGIPAYSSMAKGEISHGLELETIYNESKINLHMHPYTTTHQRVFEAIASGGFLLIKFIDPIKDLNPLMQYLDEGEGFLYFHNKKDLLEKVKVYMANDDKRNEIINRGRERVLSFYTYEHAVQRILETLSTKLKKRLRTKIKIKDV